MKQDAFIQRLRQSLASLPKQEVEEIVADYREYIGDAIAAGRSEEDVIAALGDPDKLAREIKAQATYRQWQARRSFGNLARVVASVAGLGLLNLILLVPFIIYLSLLTVGYVVSGALALAGLLAAVYVGSHQAFGWPAADKPTIHVSKGTGRAASAASSVNGHEGSDQAPDLGTVKVDGDDFVLALDEGDKASIVTHAGVLELKNDDGDTKIVALGNGADKLLTKTGENTYRIATSEVKALEANDEDGKAVSVTHANDGKTLLWDIRDEDGSGRVQFEQDAKGNTSRLAVESGAHSVVIDPSKGITVKSNDDMVHIVAPMGWSLGGMTLRYALAMLIGGALGLLICIWLTRLTWRALSRYVNRQIAALSARLDEPGQTS
ncbi:hypothetical protein C0Z18_29260 [Trinickia dabaoshanensis]|uniref:DUF1700 domain-containing protein n=1 Tax=Trinickia dabaoshanensis TaxID=564714 RepID=A0A2N7VCW0_9BURK|nr:DUF1700 domain-containing protein [Trinickia dabaoshanensis]PMS14990.1 hypothetical protein C0Z18_29260 [Trinickia dabaoshanensis]